MIEFYKRVIKEHPDLTYKKCKVTANTISVKVKDKYSRKKIWINFYENENDIMIGMDFNTLESEGSIERVRSSQIFDELKKIIEDNIEHSKRFRMPFLVGDGGVKAGFSYTNEEDRKKIIKRKRSFKEEFTGFMMIDTETLSFLIPGVLLYKEWDYAQNNKERFFTATVSLLPILLFLFGLFLFIYEVIRTTKETVLFERYIKLETECSNIKTKTKKGIS